jgi:hypothetical protein
MTFDEADKKARKLWGRRAKAYRRPSTFSPCGVGVFGTTITVGKMTTMQPWGIGATFEEAFAAAEATVNHITRASGMNPTVKYGKGRKSKGKTDLDEEAVDAL